MKTAAANCVKHKALFDGGIPKGSQIHTVCRLIKQKKPNGQRQFICLICEQKKTYGRTPNNMRKHVQACHLEAYVHLGIKIKDASAKTKEAVAKLPPTMRAAEPDRPAKRPKTIDSATLGLFQRHMEAWTFKRGLPPSILEHEELEAAIKILHPDATLPSRRTIVKHVRARA